MTDKELAEFWYQKVCEKIEEIVKGFEEDGNDRECGKNRNEAD